jgi:hypothetical protein
VKPHSVFLRKGCVLPGHLDPVRSPYGDKWKLVEEITASIFDTMIRQAGWHSMWMPGSCSRRGFGLTAAKATHRALTRGLNAVPRQFNAAELQSVYVSWYPGFCVASVTLHPREVMHSSMVEITPEERLRTAHARKAKDQFA